jgi:hypothetical protein
MKKYLAIVMVLFLASSIASVSAEGPIINRGQIHMDAYNGNCGYTWYYDINYYDAEGKEITTSAVSVRRAFNTHDESYSRPTKAASMTIKVGAHGGGSHTWVGIPNQDAAFKCKGMLGTNAKVEYNFADGAKGSQSLNA